MGVGAAIWMRGRGTRMSGDGARTARRVCSRAARGHSRPGSAGQNPFGDDNEAASLRDVSPRAGGGGEEWGPCEGAGEFGLAARWWLADVDEEEHV